MTTITLRDRMAIARLLAEDIAQNATVQDARVYNRYKDTRAPEVTEGAPGTIVWTAEHMLRVYEKEELPGLEGTGRAAIGIQFIVGVGEAPQDARDDLRDQLLQACRRIVSR